jgi:hypothetical protein
VSPRNGTKKEGKYVKVTLSTDVANLYLNGLQGEWGLKSFQGITTAPILSDDGSFRTAAGYDEASGLWCHRIPAIDIPERPTKAQAKASLNALRWFFRTFAFADATMKWDRGLRVNVVDLDAPIGLDESSALAALMTSVCRASLILTPGILANAPAISGAGTGKGLWAKAICIIGSGASPRAFTAGHDAEELDKRLTSALVEARPAVFLDNYNAKDLTSDILASALTENPCEVRPLGHTEMVPLHARTLIAVTGNAVTIAEDQVRRWVKIDFDAKCEHPEQRPFAPGFLDTVYAARAALLSHVLTIWRWGRQNAEELVPGKPLGSYEVWAQWCRDPLLALGVRDPVDRIDAVKAADPKRKQVLGVFEAWWGAYEDKPVGTKDLAWGVVQAIDQRARIFGTEFQYSRQFVARWLALHAGARVGGYVLKAETSGPPSKLIYVYRLERVAGEEQGEGDLP